MKRQPDPKPVRAWCLVDTDNSICIGLMAHERKALEFLLGHPGRRLVRVEVRAVPMPPKRKNQ